MMLKYLGICLFVCLAAAKHELYDGHALYGVDITSKEQAAFLDELQLKHHVKVLTTSPPGVDSHILVGKDDRESVENELSGVEIKFKVLSENIKEQLELEDQLLSNARARSNRTRSAGGLPLDRVYTYEEINEYIEDLANRYPGVVTIDVSGKTIEGRDYKYLKISSSNFQDQSKPIVMVQSLLHAREWITQSVTLYAIQKLVIDVTERDLIQDIDWIIVPVANPDGYIQSHVEDRFWRKNTRKGLMINDLCYGVDLNRNFDIFWGQHSSNLVCFDDYRGTSAFSEPEAIAIKEIFERYGARIELYLDIHSFGSMILYGYGNGQLPANALGLHVVGVNMAQTIDQVKWASNPNYVVGNIANVIYQATGGGSDYATAIGIPFSYVYELPSYRGISGSLLGFLVDPDFIEQAGFETWEGIKVAARFVAANTKNGRV